ncbi:hypothetical protein NSA50_16910 [Clostridium sp. DSM 100503]|uniref:hypothetical protein n=1 Tax=Clostridium sp. DSM 100503 TaxID=2963282 RepID=UPI00214A642C|nr:hypothetical protein [Clostridium sp. DSM 100503]MCR1952708.1 hypothetical protein [Clostridium sp. DSM 100503]
MLEIILIGTIIIVLITIILRHNKDFSLELNVKILGLNLSIKSKEKRTPSK